MTARKPHQFGFHVRSIVHDIEQYSYSVEQDWQIANSIVFSLKKLRKIYEVDDDHFHKIVTKYVTRSFIGCSYKHMDRIEILIDIMQQAGIEYDINTEILQRTPDWSYESMKGFHNFWRVPAIAREFDNNRFLTMWDLTAFTKLTQREIYAGVMVRVVRQLNTSRDMQRLILNLIFFNLYNLTE